MSVWSRLKNAWRALRLGTMDERFWTALAGGGGKSAAGINVTEELALNISAVYRAIALISGTTATLPLYTYQRQSPRKSHIVEGHRVERLLGVGGRPNDNMDGLTLRETLQACIFTKGNGLAEIQRAGGEAAQIHLLNPDRVRPLLGGDGAIAYKVQRQSGGEVELDRSQVLHLKNLGGDGLWGWSTIRRARETLGLSIATERAGAQIFGKGIRATGAFKTDKDMQPKDAAGMLDLLRQQYAGMENTGAPMFLWGGLEWDPFTIDPNDAQFLQTRKFQIEEIARWFGVPPHLLAALDRATFSNIEHQAIEFLRYCLRYWLVKWETALGLLLLTEEERRQGYYVAHDTADLLKGDIKARFDAYSVGRNAGFLTVNMILEREDEDTIGPEGDVFLVPQNMADLKTLLKPEAADDKAEGEQPTDADGAAPAAAKKPKAPFGGPPGEPPAEEEDDDADLAHRDLLIDALERLAGKSRRAALDAAAKPGGFLQWVEEFHGQHEGLAQRTLAPVLTAWLSVSMPVKEARYNAPRLAQDLAAKLVQLSQGELLELAGEATAKELPQRVALWVEQTKSRPADLAEETRATLCRSKCLTQVG